MYYSHRTRSILPVAIAANREKVENIEYVYQCRHCKSIYDEAVGDTIAGVESGTAFMELPGEFVCFTCEAGKEDFEKIEKSSLELLTV